MNRTTIPINEIKVEDRQRLDLGNIQELANSIQRFGLIQPIVINQEKRLISGGRRLAATIQLGHPTIDVVFKETLSVDELHELELEENVRRKEMTWQEKCLTINQIHFLKLRRSAANAESWGQRETGEMLGITGAHVNYTLKIAKALKQEPKHKVWQCESLSDAWKLLLRDKEDEILAALAAKAKADAPTISVEENKFFENLDIATEEIDMTTVPTAVVNSMGRPYYSLSKQEALSLYQANSLNPPEKFEEYYQWKIVQANEKRTIPISKFLHNMDSIKFMNETEERFDHIITDIPYGIDMSMLDQGQMQNIDTVEAAHDVKYNLKLIADFFPAAYRCTKDNSFVITWGDQMLWQYMYDHAIKAGFAVQRWPITWVKTSSCMNQCATFNTTKDTEIAIVCRKKGATLITQPQTSVITAPRDKLSEEIRHPFAKPFAVWEFLTNMVSLPGQSILEPFSGGGSGVISMLRLARKVTGVELEQVHYNELVENVKSIHYLRMNPDFLFI